MDGLFWLILSMTFRAWYATVTMFFINANLYNTMKLGKTAIIEYCIKSIIDLRLEDAFSELFADIVTIKKGVYQHVECF